MALEALTSDDILKLGGKSLQVYQLQLLVRHIARDNSGLSLARRKDATCFLRWIMSVITDTTVQMCHQKANGKKTIERRVSTVILNVYQSTGIEKEESSRKSLESHGKFDEIRRFYNKKFEEGHDVHRNLARAEEYGKPTKRGENQYVSGVMGIAYNPFLDSEAGNACMNFQVAELLKFWAEKIIEIDPTERERPSLGLLLDKNARGDQRAALEQECGTKDGKWKRPVGHEFGDFWKLLRPS